MRDTEYIILTILSDEWLRVHEIQRTYEHRWGPIMYSKVTNILTKMHKNGLVTRRDCPTDPRFKVYRITKKGEQKKEYRCTQLNHLLSL